MKMICDFCYRHCDISEGGYGYCQARTVRSGQLEDRNYGELAAAAIDPVEKKPLYHFLPGTRTLSVAMEGCSLSCAFCQNHEIAKGHHEGFPFTAPETLSEYAITHSIPSLSFTYTEPIVWQDYAMEAALSAKEHGLRTIMVTNGTFSNEALDRLLPLIDGEKDFSICMLKIYDYFIGHRQMLLNIYSRHFFCTAVVCLNDYIHCCVTRTDYNDFFSYMLESEY